MFVCLCLSLEQFKLLHSVRQSNLRGKEVSVANWEDVIRSLVGGGVKLKGFGNYIFDLDLALIHLSQTYNRQTKQVCRQMRISRDANIFI